ncbi:MAG TPA: adenylate/guanylate cyclase domain-containing protein, partial [bacterium]|nr:adenylate/guanylate cyclase domain-containing protein [bacterium]
MKSSPYLKLLVTIAAFLIGTAVVHTPAVKKLDFSFLDLMMISVEPEAPAQSALIAVDQYSLSVFGWPVDRELYGAMISVLTEAGAKKVGFDLFFTDRKEETDPEAFKRMVESEEILGEESFKAGAILGSFVNTDYRKDPSKVVEYPPTPEKSRISCPCNDLSQEETDEAKFKFLEKMVAGVLKFNPLVAHVHVIPSDVDRVNRTIIGCKKVFDGCVPDLALAMVGKEPYEGCCHEEIIPYFRTSSEFTVISMVDVIESSGSEEKMKILKEKVAGKYVFVGATDETLKDIGPTPSGLVEPLVFLHLNRAEALLNNIRITRIPQWIIILIPLLLLILSAIFFEHVRAFMISGTVWVVLVYAASYVLFRNSYVFIPSMEMFIPFLFANIACAGYLGWKYFLFNQVLSNAFDNYVSPEILSWLKETGGKVLQSNSAERRQITILFSDIAGYTSLSNSLNAENIMKSLRLYLDAMMTITAEHNGYVDKINGDGLMILFGAPKPFNDHAKKALDCAVAMQKKVHEMQDEWMAVTGRELKIRIGMATGTVFVGNLGGAGHIEYSAIGRGVNFAARLESKSDIGGILISEETVE